MVIVNGNHLSQSIHTCRFVVGLAEKLTLARWISPAQIECIAPKFTAGLSALEVSINGQQFSHSQLTFQYIQTMQLLELQPLHGPHQGGTPIVIRTRHLRNYLMRQRGQIACRFNQTYVPATGDMEKENVVYCISPVSPQVGSVIMHITSHGQVISDDLRFEYQEVHVQAVSPSAGPVSGDTRVHISGTQFTAVAMSCVFDGTIVAATMESATSIACSTPVHPTPGRITLKLLCHGANCGDPLSFMYFMEDRLANVQLSPVSGPSRGGTQVDIMGHDFRLTDNLVCEFGVASVPAFWLDAHRLVCASPESSSENHSAVQMRLSLNGQQFTRLAASVTFTYHQPRVIMYVKPAKGPVAGGITVQLLGLNLYPAKDENVMIRFGEIVVPASAEESGHLNCRMPPLVSGYVAVSVSINNGWEDSNEVLFEALESNALSVFFPVYPLHGLRDGNAAIHVSARGLYTPVNGWYCGITGEPAVQARFDSASRVSCMIPLTTLQRNVAIQLLDDDFILSSPSIELHGISNVTSIAPSTGPRYGGTVVTVGFSRELRGVQRNSIFCRFGSTLVPALSQNAHSIECAAPSVISAYCPRACLVASTPLDACPEPCEPTTPHDVSVGVVAENQDHSHGGIFTYTADMHTSELWPLHGPAVGGTEIWIKGSGFSDDMQCHIGDTAVLATVHSQHLLRCLTPYGSPGYVTVEVSMDIGASYSSDGLVFGYKALHLQHVYPSAGPVSGGTTVVAYGENLLPHGLSCVMDGVELETEYQNVYQIHCVMPPRNQGIAEVFLRSMGTLISSSAVRYYYEDDMIIAALHPARGALNGATSVTVTGVGFKESATLYCAFRTVSHASQSGVSNSAMNTLVVAGRWIDQHQIVCPSPAVGEPCTAVVEISTNGQDFTSSALEHEFEFTIIPVLGSIHPPTGPVLGGSVVSVLLLGEPIQLGWPWQCRFGSITVSATPQSLSLLQCVAPASAAGFVTVELTNNGQDFTGSWIAFEYVAYSALSMTPSTGPAAGSTLLTFQAETGNIGQVPDSLYCKFESMKQHDVVKATAISIDSVQCKTPPSSYRSIEVVLVSHMASLAASPANFYYYTRVRVEQVHPSYGPADGGTNVLVAGAGFQQASAWSCAFGHALTTARILSDQQVECITPPANPQTSTIDLQLTANGVDFVSGKQFAYTPSLHLARIHPVRGPMAGGVAVSIFLAFELHRSHSPIYECSFNGTLVAASVVQHNTESNALLCESPAYVTPGNVQVELTENGGKDVSNSLLFEYVQVRVTRVQPLSGPIAGGTVLVFEGVNFGTFADSTHLCYFGADPPLSVARVLSATELTCVAPTVDTAEIVELTIQNGGATYPGVVRFAYYKDPQLASLHPAFGPLDGGTAVTISGAGFPSTLLPICRFGKALPTFAIWLDSHAVICISPSLELSNIGASGLALSLNGKDFVTASETFEYHDSILLHHVYPTCGPVRGGTYLQIQGGPFLQRAAELKLLACRIGSSVVEASLQSTSALTCVSPPSDAAYATIDITSNRHDFTASFVTFQYESNLLTDIQPLQGPVGGGVALTLTAGHTCGRLQCQFGGDSIVPASRLSSTHVTCMTPAQNVPAHISVKLDIHGVLTTTTASHRYMLVARVHSARPWLVPLEGGTRVQIQGRNFIPSHTLHCLFGDDLVEAHWLSSLQLTCVAPPARLPGIVTVAVTNDGFAPSLAVANLTYRSLPVLAALQPTAGPNHGGTLMSVHGSGFAGSYAPSCRFSSSTTISDTPASVMNDAILLCHTPPAAQMRKVTLEVSMTGVDYTVSAQTLGFKYYEHCHISAVQPVAGPVHGGSVITLSGGLFEAHDELMCRFSAEGYSPEYVAASVVENSLLHCQTPAFVEADVRIHVGYHDFGVQWVAYAFQPIPAVTIIRPALGPQSGGSTVQLVGANFRNSASLACIFGDTFTEARFINEALLNCTTPSMSGVALVRATNDRSTFSALPTNVTYTFVVEPVAAALVPSHGPVRGQINVSVFGRNLPQASSCVFGKGLAPSTWISSTHVLCTAPQDLPLYRSVVLSIAAPGIRVGGLSYNVVPDPIVDTVWPNFGPNLGGSIVTLSGRNFDHSTVCKFGLNYTEAATEFIGSSRLKCLTPSNSGVSRSTFISVGSSDHPQHGSSRADYRYHEPCEFNEVSPSFGSEAGGAHFLVSGANFVQGARPQLWLGNLEAACHLINSSAIECISPPRSPGIVTTRLLFNGLDICANTGVFFTYVSVHVEEVLPVFGPTLGGTQLTIRGSHFSSSASISCVMGVQVVSAFWASAGTVLCRTPPSTAGGTHLSITVEGRPLQSDRLFFEYQAPLRISSVTPSVGTTKGGTLVTVSGQHFSLRSASLSYLKCRVNLTVVAATFQDASSVVCITPPHAIRRLDHQNNSLVLAAGDVPIEITNNMVDFSNDGVHFNYNDHVTLSHVIPASGPVQGHTLVRMMGSNFVQSTELSCRFGEYVTPATFQSMTEVLCQAPMHPAGAVHIQVVVNTVDATHEIVHFTFTAILAITQLSPANGPKRGGTDIVVQGRNFPRTRQLHCKFGSILVHAVYISSTLLNCTSPAHSAGLVAVEVGDGLDFTRSNLTFLYQETVTVDSVLPAVVPANRSVAFRVVGSNFLLGSSCALGDLAAEFTTVLSATELVCSFGPLEDTTSASVRVSSNAQDYTESSAELKLASPWYVTHLIPNVGPLQGNTLVEVHGSGFVDVGADLVCRFGLGLASNAILEDV